MVLVHIKKAEPEGASEAGKVKINKIRDGQI